MTEILLIGRGPWGEKYAKTLASISNVKFKIAGKDSWQKMLEEKPDGVIICTHPDSHVEIALTALAQDIPIMLEKPAALCSEDLKLLTHFNLPILVNYSMLFTKAFEMMKDFSLSHGIAELDVFLYNSGPFRSYSGLWDYGPHVLALVFSLFDRQPTYFKIKKYFTSSESTQQGVLYDLELFFKSNKADVLFGNGGIEKVHKYNIRSNGLNLSYDDLTRPNTHTPPLTNAIDVFLQAIDGKDDWRLGLDLSKKITNTLENCDKLLIIE